MIILVILALSILVALIRGGNLGRFADISLRWRGVIIFGFLIQVLIFSDGWQARPDLKTLTPIFYIASMFILLVAVAYNYRIPGFPLIVLGLGLNLLAILFNRGYMPASIEALAIAGHKSVIPGQVTNNSIVMEPNTQLYFLCDIFAIPKGFIFPNVFSVGDISLTAGGAYLIQKTLVKAQVRPEFNNAKENQIQKKIAE
jgi:hypothetical protein